MITGIAKAKATIMMFDATLECFDAGIFDQGQIREYALISFFLILNKL